jgi:Rieske Fe-S protein
MTTCRRTVLKGAAATCGVGLLAACGGGDEQESAQATTGGSAGSGEPLIQLDEVPVGGAKGVTASNGDKVIVTRPTEDEAVAFDATCPHQGCTVAPDDEQLSCPCHGSQFELDGSLKKGPAEKGLQSYAVQVVDGQVLPA